MTHAIAAVHAPTLAAVRRAIAAHAEARFAAGDLSLGSWRAHGLAFDTARQLGIVLDRTPPAAPLNGFAYADVIDRQIDGEAQGDTGAFVAHAHAARLAHEGPFTLFVIPPRFGAAWEREDALFILFLGRLGAARVVLLPTDDEISLPGGCHADRIGAFDGEPLAATRALDALVPGLVTNGSDYALPLAGGLHLIAPELRRDPRSVDRLELDRLAVTMTDDEDVVAFAQFHGNTLFVDADLLARRASAAFEAGAAGIAARLLERAAACAGGIRKAAMLCQLQGMRIAAGRFDDAIAIDEPSPSFPAAIRSFLFEARGWGLVMCGHPQEAAEAIEQAQGLRGDAPPDRELLYLLNILALCRFRSGNLEGALELERAIEREAAALSASWPLRYVNAINQARIHRRRGDLDAAWRAYEKAFATTLGARSDGDAIYTNICFAGLAAARGMAGEAFAYRMRAALHFCACEVPEALGARTVGAILPRNGGPFAIREEVAGALLAALRDAVADPAGLAKIDAASEMRPVPRFVRFDRRGADAVATCLHLGDGWSAIALANTAIARIGGECSRRLRRWLGAVIDQHAPDARTHDLFAIDRSAGEMAATELDALAACVCLPIPRLTAGGRSFDLPPDVRRRLALDAHAVIAPHVAAIGRTPPSVTFKRYLPPRRLTEPELAALDRVTRENVSWSEPALTPVIEAGLVTLRLSEDACETAGIRSHSNAMSLHP